jgi:uncharacterized membrane protein required for colicin V production
MTTGSTNDILAAALPIVLAVIFGILGAVRGFRREAIVSGSIVLGVLIVEQWASRWADDLYGMYTGASREWQQVALSMVVLSLVVLVLGYGLGTLTGRGPLSGGSRAGGLLLGLINGSALGGWLLRYIYLSLDGAQPSSPLYQNAITQGFMIWAGWFPVALAVLGTLVALVSPFRRPQVEVTEVAPPPAPVPVWTPPPPVPTYTPPTAYGAPPPPGRIPGSVGAATPYDRTVANPSPYATQPGPQTPYNAPTARSYGGLEPPLPPRDPYNPYPPDTTTRGFTPTTRDVGAAPSTEVLSGGYQPDTNRDAPLYRGSAGKIDTDSLFVPTPSSASDEPEPPSSEGPEALRPSADWLATPASSASSQSAIADVEDVAEPQPQVQDEAEAQAAEPEEPEPTGVMAASESGDMAETSEASEASEARESGETGEAPEPEVAGTTYIPTEMTCSNCGAPVLSDAKFCTECGTRVVHA